MAQLMIKDILDREKNKPAIIACHGPSLNFVKKEVLQLQREKKALRFSPNNWIGIFENPPDYWVLANTEKTMGNMEGDLNRFNVPVFFADSVDLTDYSFIEKQIKCDYYGYDQRHFKNSKCKEIVNEFKKHVLEHKNFDFEKYGNNKTMWAPPRYKGGAGFSGILNHGIGRQGNCCKRIIKDRLTIQEELQKYTNYDKHYSTGDTVLFHMLALAIIMGCNPIYVTGADLDYHKGYADEARHVPALGLELDGARENLLNDLRIIIESAKKKNVKIINLNKNSWYDIFETGEIESV